MTQQKPQHKGLTPPKCFVSTLPGQSLCWLISISLLSEGVVFAEEILVDNIIPTIQNSPPGVIANTKVEPTEPTNHSTVKTSSSASALLPLKEAPVGTPVLAAARGQVETADWMGGYGLAVIINHNSAEQSLYGHMSQIFVHPGQWVEPGTVIGQVGSTGFSTGPHLHFEILLLTQG